MRNTGMTIKVWLFLLAMLGNGLLVRAQTVPATRQYANSKAAIVMVRTEMLAEVNVPRININNKAFNQLLDSSTILKSIVSSFPHHKNSILF